MNCLRKMYSLLNVALQLFLNGNGQVAGYLWSVHVNEGMGEYVDEGVSGSKESRPELNRLMVDAHRRQFDIVLVWKIDRFGRSLKHLVNTLGDLDTYGVAFASLKDNLDLSTPSGRLMFQIIGAMAEFELSLCRERVRAGLQNARRNGKQLGRPSRVVDLASIARMKADGHSLRSIAHKLGVGYGTVRTRLAAGERKSASPKAAAKAGMQGVKSPVPVSGKQ